jgi:hypothetical protein
MFDWFINKYGKTTTKDCKENRQKMAADWHPSNGFEPLTTRLFIGASYASAACYRMNNCNVIDIGLHVIKWCGMYSKEYKNWIAHKSKTLAIVKTIDSFKKYWARGITLINQTSIPAAQHGYGIAAMENNALHASYSKLLANFGAAYAATQETMKTQATSMAAMQGQLANIHQFCMAVGQQPPPTIYVPTQQQHMSNNRRGRRNDGGHNGGSGGGNGGGGFPQQPTWFGSNRASAQQPSFPPTPYKHWENWNYCHTHGGNLDNAHMSATCGNCGLTHNPNASRANIMGGSIARMHKTILPLARGRKPPPTHCPQQQQLPQRCPPGAYYPTQGTNASPAYFGAIQSAGGTYRQQTTMAMPIIQTGQTMMNFVGQQFPSSAGAAPMMQQPTQQAMPMMAPYYAPNQQTYSAPNKQYPGYF